MFLKLTGKTAGQVGRLTPEQRGMFEERIQNRITGICIVRRIST